MLFRTGLICLLAMTSFADVPQDRKGELKAAADRILMMTDVDRRSQVKTLFELADLYLEENEPRAAEHYLEHALRVESLNLPYQVKHARLLIHFDKKDQAAEKLLIVYRLAEDSALINQARELLGEAGAPVVLTGRKDPENITGSILYLVPIGEKNEALLWEAAVKLEGIVGIPVVVAANVIDPGPYDRTEAERYINRTAERMQERLSPEDMAKYLRLSGIASIETAPYEKKKLIVQMFFKDIMDDEDYLEFLSEISEDEKDGQHRAGRLQTLLNSHRSQLKNAVGLIGVSSMDMYDQDNNFLFGLSGYQLAVMSYYRFGSEFNRTRPNRPRLVDRFVKQATSCTMFVLGIERCSSPLCMRAYPNSLDEHDAKDNTLCSWCQQELQKKRKQLGIGG